MADFAKTNWGQHRIICLLARNNDLSIAAMSMLKGEHFTHGVYRKVFDKIEETYIKKGRLMTWREITSDPRLPDNVIRNLKSLEVKRTSISEEDRSITIPKTVEEMEAVIKSVILDSQRIKLTEIHNAISDILSEENMLEEDVNGVLKLMSDGIKETNELATVSDGLVEVSAIPARELYEDMVNGLSNFCIPTGFANFDRFNKGIPRDAFFVIAARSGTGKSTMGLQIPMNQYLLGARVCVSSHEMGKQRYLLRMASNLTRISKNEIMNDPTLYRKKIVNAFKKFFRYSEEGGGSFLLHFPTEDCGLDDLFKLLEPYSLDNIVIDSLNLLKSVHENQARSLDLIGRACKMHATAHNRIVTGIAQWDNKESQIRYSRALLEHSSEMFAWETTREEISELRRIQIMLPKARDFEALPFWLSFDGSTSRIYDFTGDGPDDDGVVAPMADGFDSI